MVKRFNKEMDQYLRSRRESRFDLRFPRKKKEEQVPEMAEGEVHIEERPSFWSRLFGTRQRDDPDEDLTPDEQAKLEAMEGEIEVIDEAEAASTDAEEIEELEERREGLLERFFGSFRLFTRRHDLEDRAEELAEAEELADEEWRKYEEEFKEAMKIAHKWIGKLPKRQRDAFMVSDDYKRWKQILKEHGVAK